MPDHPFFMVLKSVWARLRYKATWAVLLETRVGIKSRNQLIHSQFLPAFAKGETEFVQASDLVLGLDALADNYTLLCTPLLLSPHYDLFKRFAAGGDISSCDYVTRLKQGTLDFRGPIPITPALMKGISAFLERKLDPASCEPPVLIARIGNKQLIVDGKHKAAALAWRNLAISCLDITTALYDSYYRWIYNFMKKRGARYNRHIHFFDPFYAKMEQK